MRANVLLSVVLLGALAGVRGTIGADEADKVPAPDNLIQQKAKSVVRIECLNAMGRPVSGTGFVWSKPQPGTVVTALHVVAGGSKIKVTYESDGKIAGWSEAEVSHVLRDFDLALLDVKSPPKEFPPLELANALPKPGEHFNAVGYPLTSTVQLSCDATIPLVVEDHTLSTLISNDQANALPFPSPKVDLLKLQSGIVPGDSGGPIFDDQGLVIGVADGGLAALNGQGIAWGIPATQVARLHLATDRQPTKEELNQPRQLNIEILFDYDIGEKSAVRRLERANDLKPMDPTSAQIIAARLAAMRASRGGILERDSLYARALSALASGDYPQASRLLAMDREHGSVDLAANYRSTGDVAYRQDRFQDAVGWYQKAVESGPKNVATERDMAVCLAKLGRSDDSLVHYNTVVQLLIDAPTMSGRDDDLATARQDRAMVESDLGKVPEAIQDLDLAVDLRTQLAKHQRQPDAGAMVSVLLNRAQVFYSSGQKERALPDLDRAGHVAAGVPDIGSEVQAGISSFRATILTELGRPNEAIPICNETVAMLTRTVDAARATDLDRVLLAVALSSRGNVYRTLKQFTPAMADLNKAVGIVERLMPGGHAEYGDLIAGVFLMRAATYADMKNKTAAETDGSRALAVAHDSKVKSLIEKSLSDWRKN